MKMYRKEFPIEKMASILGVSKVGYYRFLKEKPSKRSQENERLLKKIKEIHQESHKTYGSPRIHAELKDLGESCSRQRVARLMRASHIVAKMHKRFKKTTHQSGKPYFCCRRSYSARLYS